MLLIHCPYCEEERPELEFRNAGEAHVVRPANMADMSDEDFEGYFFIRANPKGVAFERWRHVHGCGRFFNAVRHSVTDRFLATYKAGAAKPDVSRLVASQPEAADRDGGTEAAAPAPAKPPRAQARVARAGTRKPADAGAQGGTPARRAPRKSNTSKGDA